MAVRSMKFVDPLHLCQNAIQEAKNILGLRFGQNRSGICVWNLAEGTVKPLMNNVEGASQPYVILDHTRYSIDEISKQLDAIAIDQHAVGYLAGFPDHPRYRQDPNNGCNVKKHLLGLDATNIHAGRCFSLFSDRYTTKFHDEYLYHAYGGCVEKKDAALKTMAATFITRKLKILVEGGEGFMGANDSLYKDYEESQSFMYSVGVEQLGYRDRVTEDQIIADRVLEDRVKAAFLSFIKKD